MMLDGKMALILAIEREGWRCLALDAPAAFGLCFREEGRRRASGGPYPLPTMPTSPLFQRPGWCCPLQWEDGSWWYRGDVATCSKISVISHCGHQVATAS